MEQFARERDAAFTKAVMHNDWNAVRKYCKKYEVPIPKDLKVFKAGIYKAVQGCTNIPQEVKDKAFVECLKLGFSPFIRSYEVQE